MINRNRRSLLADQIHALISGFTSNYDFDDWLVENDFCADRDPRLYDDAALGPILERAYCLYSDSPRYTLTGKHKITACGHLFGVRTTTESQEKAAGCMLQGDRGMAKPC